MKTRAYVHPSNVSARALDNVDLKGRCQLPHRLLLFTWHDLEACTKTRNAKTKPPKRNDRNDQNETTKTKRAKRNDRNETSKTKRPKRNEQNETTENLIIP